ncbi:MAG: hypothetical protein ACKOKG_07945 [Verrucomicrobiota bacterium]
MSAVAIIAPLVVSSWPAISAAVASAAVSLGFSVAREVAQECLSQDLRPGSNTVTLDVPNCSAVTGTLGRDQRIRLSRDGVQVEFSRDARGRDSVCVTGEGLSEEQLRAIGDEVAGRTVQHYVLAKLKSEMAGKGMDLVEETVDENRSIRLRVRHWQH